MPPAPDAPLPSDLQALLDERAIREVLVRYCRGVDRCDEALIASCYHPDAVDEHGPFRGSGEEFAAFVVKTLRATFEATTHMLANEHVVLSGDEARVESYVTATHRRTRRSGEVQLVVVGARYLDRFTRREGVWKIAHRVVVLDWNRVDTVDAAFPEQGYRLGARAPDDPSCGEL